VNARRLLVSALAVALLGTAGVATAQDTSAERLRQLEAFERLLTETIQARVSERVNDTIDAARRGDADEDGVPEAEAAEPLVVKVGQPLAAHGLYIDGFGVMFSIQTPQVTVIPQSFEVALAGPRAILRTRDGNNFAFAEGNDQVIELRVDMLDRSLDDLIVLLERHEDGPHTVKVEELESLRATLDNLRREMIEDEERNVLTEADPEVAVRVERERLTEAARARAAAEAEAGGVGRRIERRRGAEFFFRGMMEQREETKEILERNHRRIAAAMNEAALRTLADYGAVLKGLDDDERVAIVVLPPNAWSFARNFGIGVNQDEHVVTVRFGDIRDHLNGDIDYDEFVERAQIRDRLGLHLVHEDDDQD